MATYTTNLNLKKPAGSDTASITDINNNMDTLDTVVAGKQATLVSGTNIKTVNNNSLLGSGNLTIGGGGWKVATDSLKNYISQSTYENVKYTFTVYKDLRIEIFVTNNSNSITGTSYYSSCGYIGKGTYSTPYSTVLFGLGGINYISSSATGRTPCVNVNMSSSGRNLTISAMLSSGGLSTLYSYNNSNQSETIGPQITSDVIDISISGTGNPKYAYRLSYWE